MIVNVDKNPIPAKTSAPHPDKRPWFIIALVITFVLLVGANIYGLGYYYSSSVLANTTQTFGKYLLFLKKIQYYLSTYLEII